MVNNHWLVVWNMFYFSIQLGMSSSQLTHIFQRGRSTTNQIITPMSIFCSWSADHFTSRCTMELMALHQGHQWTATCRPHLRAAKTSEIAGKGRWKISRLHTELFMVVYSSQ